MRITPVGIIAVLVLTLSRIAAAEADGSSLPHFRVLLRTGDRIEGSKGTLTPQSLTGTSKGGSAIDVPRADIRALDVSRGTHAGQYALIGAGMGLLTGLLAILQVSSDETATLKEGAAAIVTIGLTAGGGLIGAAVGASSRTWEPVPLQTSLRLDPARRGALASVSVRF